MIGVLHYIESDGISGITRLVLNLAQEQRHNPNLRVGLLVGRQRGELIPRFEALGAEIKHPAYVDMPIWYTLYITNFVLKQRTRPLMTKNNIMFDFGQ